MQIKSGVEFYDPLLPHRVRCFDSVAVFIRYLEFARMNAEGIHPLVAVQNIIKSGEPFQDAVHGDRPVLFLFFSDLHPLCQFH